MSHLNKLNSVLCSAAVALSVLGAPVSVFAEEEPDPTPKSTEVKSDSELIDPQSDPAPEPTPDPNPNPQESKKYIVTFNDGTKTWEVTVELKDGATSAPYTLPKDRPSKTGFEFAGWSDGQTLYQPGDNITVDADMTLTAEWEPDKPAQPSNPGTTVSDLLKELGDKVSGLVADADASAIKADLEKLKELIDKGGSATGTVVIENLNDIKSKLDSIKDTVKNTNGIDDALKEEVGNLADEADQVLRKALADSVDSMVSDFSGLTKPDSISREGWDSIGSELGILQNTLKDNKVSYPRIAKAFSDAATQIEKVISPAAGTAAKTEVDKIIAQLEGMAEILDPSLANVNMPAKPAASKVEELLKDKALIISMKSGNDTITETFGLTKDTYTIGSVAKKVGSADTYYCPITIKTDEYKKEFAKDQKLKSVTGAKTVTVDLTYDKDKETWTVTDADIPTLTVTGEEKTEYTVTLKTGESTTWRTLTATVESGKTSAVINLPNAKPTKSGYTFVAWKNESTGKTYNAGEQIVVKADMTLVATWKTGKDTSSPNTAAMNPAGDSAFFATTLAAAAGLGVLAAVKAFRKD